MNPLHESKIQTRSAPPRSGLTIIEVLTSIVVAMIGVFGVMVLIPFAVKQAQTGLDSDAAVMLGRNAYSQFEIGGYRFPTNWAVYIPALGREVAYSPYENWDSDFPIDGNKESPPMAPQILSIDPLGIAESGIPGLTTVDTAYGNAVFPYNRLDVGTPYPIGVPLGTPDLRFRAACLGTPAGTTMANFVVTPAAEFSLIDVQGQSLARRMFRSSDDLIFGEAADELLGPEQYFDRDGAGGFLRRQSNGRLSWSAIVVPFKDDPALIGTTRWSYKMYILVYKDRKTFIDATPDPNDQMRTVLVTNTLTANPLSNVFLESTATPLQVQGVVNRDDWVMLINQDANAEAGFDRQVAFYRVVSSSDQTSTQSAILTLDGPPFIFTDPADATRFSGTYSVHLQNVVAVYEQTFVPEAESGWNISL